MRSFPLKHYALFGKELSGRGRFIQKLLKGEPASEMEELKYKKGELFSDAVLEKYLEEDYRHGHTRLNQEGERSLRTFSSGEKRKVLLNYLLEHAPDFLVLDNAFGSLDQESVSDIKRRLKEISCRTTIVQIFKREKDLLPFIDEVVVIKGEKVEEVLSPQEFKNENKVEVKQQSELRIPPPIRPYNGIPEELVRMCKVSVNYGDKPILKDISWTINKGEFWQLTGPNGSGKTTLLDMIYGDNPKAYGEELFLFGNKKGTGESVWEIKQKIGYFSPAVTQFFKGRHTTEQMLVGGFVDSIGLYREASDKQLALAREWLEVLDLTRERNKAFPDLPLLQQRLVLIARAMVKHPPLLILDEPSASLDEESVLLLSRLINIIAAETSTAIIYVSHRKEKGLKPFYSYNLLPGKEGSIGEVVKH